MKKTAKLFLGMMAILMAASLVLTGCSSNDEISLGEWSGSTYTNETVGVTFNMPANWTRTSDAEMAAALELGADLLDIPDDFWEDADTATLMAASSPTGSNINIMVERATGRVSASASARAVVQEFETMGLEARVISGTVRIGDNNWHQYAIDFFGMTVYGFVSAQGRFANTITITIVPGSETLDDILAMFN